MSRYFLFVLVLFTGGNLAQANNSQPAYDPAFQQRFNQANQFAEQGKINAAINTYLELVKSRPQTPELYNNLAALYLRNNQADKARAVLEQGLHAHQGYGNLYDRLRDINVVLARDAYSEALQLDIKSNGVAIPMLALKMSKPEAVQVTQRPKPVVEKNPPIISSQVSVKNDTQATVASNSATLNSSSRDKALQTVIDAWATAWSAQAVDIYLSFYHSQYKPANGMSLRNWRQSRKVRLKKPGWIKIGLSEFKVERNNGRQAIVRFTQAYQSDRYSDTSRKRMVLLYTNAGWRIFSEKTI